jgi:hypothetical protein
MLALPPLDSLAAIARAQAMVVEAVCDGRIATTDALVVSGLITATGKALDAADLERRIAGLEHRLAGASRPI